MSRALDSSSWLSHWDDGDNPGAGPKGVDSTGLNGNWEKIRVAVMTGHTAAGAHGANVIDKANLATTVADGSTIERDPTVGLRVKDLGVTNAKLAANSVTASKADGSFAGSGLTATSGVLSVNVDNSTVELASGIARVKDQGIVTAKIADANVTNAKIVHDNTRTKVVIVLANNTSNQILCNGVVIGTGFGICPGRAGGLTRFSIVNNASGAASSYGENYLTYLNTFGASDKLRVGWVGANAYLSPLINGGEAHGGLWRIAATYSTEYLITLEWEFD